MPGLVQAQTAGTQGGMQGGAQGQYTGHTGVKHE